MTEAINRALGLFSAANGKTYPITNYFDADGDECVANEAMSFVAGAGSDWFCGLLSDFSGDVQ